MNYCFLGAALTIVNLKRKQICTPKALIKMI